MSPRMGGPIGLIVIGLVLALAIADRFKGVNLSMIGWIVAGAGAVWLLLELVMNRPRAQVTRETTNVQGVNPAADQRVEREVRRDQI